MPELRDPDLPDEFLEVAGFMVVSARGLLDEPAHYGPFRLVDAASRLIALLQEQGLSNVALDRLREAIEDGKTTSMGTPEEFRAFLESLVLLLVAQIGRGARNSRE